MRRRLDVQLTKAKEGGQPFRLTTPSPPKPRRLSYISRVDKSIRQNALQPSPYHSLSLSLSYDKLIYILFKMNNNQSTII